MPPGPQSVFEQPLTSLRRLALKSLAIFGLHQGRVRRCRPRLAGGVVAVIAVALEEIDGILVRGLLVRVILPGGVVDDCSLLGTFNVASRFILLKLEELPMSKRNATPSKRGDPKEQPVNRPDHKEAPPERDDCKQPPRDTSDSPVPNPSGEPVDKP